MGAAVAVKVGRCLVFICNPSMRTAITRSWVWDCLHQGICGRVVLDKRWKSYGGIGRWQARWLLVIIGVVRLSKGDRWLFVERWAMRGAIRVSWGSAKHPGHLVRDEVFLKTSLHLVLVAVGRIHWFYQGISLRPLLDQKFRLCL